MDFLQVPQLSATSTFFTGVYALSSEIVSQDTLQIFIFAIIGGIVCGITFALLKKVTSWVWH